MQDIKILMRNILCLLLKYSILLIILNACAPQEDTSREDAPGQQELSYDPVPNLSILAGDNTVSLSWTDPSGIDIGRLEVMWDDGENMQVRNVDPGVQTFMATGLTNGQGYTFTVSIYDARGIKSFSSSISVTPGDIVRPNDISAVRHSYDENTSMITLFWMNPNNEDFSYARIEWNGNPEPIIQFGSPGLETSHTFTIASARSYDFRLIAVDDDGLESQPNEYSMYAPDPPPGVVSDLLLRPQDGTAFLSWTDPIDSDLERIEITWSDGMNVPLSATVAVGVQTFMATGLTNGQEYTFTVSTYDARGTKSSTAPLSVTPQISSSPLDPPSGITITQDQEFRLRLRWTNPDHPELASINITLNGMFIENITGLSPNSVSNYTLELPYPTSEMSHTVRLKAVDTRGNGSPTLTFRGFDPINCEESNNCQIEVGQPALKGLIEKEADRDIYAVELVRGRKYRIDMERIAALPVGTKFSGLDPMLRVYHNSAHGSFIANNNGSTLAATPGDDAELWYEAERDGTHYIEATPGTVISDNGARNYTGTYRLLIEQDTGSNPSWASQLPRDGSTGLSQPARNYELVWNEEFNTLPSSSPWWRMNVYRPGITSCCTVLKRYAGRVLARRNLDAFFMWRTSIGPTIGLNNGWLQLGVAYPNYAGASEFSSHLTDDGGWRLPNGVIIHNGEIPAFAKNTTPRSSRVYLDQVVDGSAGYWTGRVDTERHFESRYGYFEVEADYSDINGFYQFFGSWWLKSGSTYAGKYELDVAETAVAPDKKRNYIRQHFRIHIGDPGGRGRRYRFTEFDHNLQATNLKIIYGLEWTPSDYCLFRDRVKIGCASGFPNGGSLRSEFFTLEQPMPHILNTTVKPWLAGANNPFDHRDRLRDELGSGGDGAATVKFNYLRVYKPQNRYGDRNPDNHIYKRPISNKNELVVLPTD